MASNSRLLLVVALALLSVSGTHAVYAQSNQGSAVMIQVPPPVPPVATAPSPPVNSNASRPGTVGTGARPTGLPGDSTSAPGFPGPVGQWRK